MVRISWGRGTFRAWVAISSLWLWVAFALLMMAAAPTQVYSGTYPTKDGGVSTEPWQWNWNKADQKSCSNAREANPGLGNVFDCFDTPVPSYQTPSMIERLGFSVGWLGVLWLLPMIVLLGVGLAARWVARGFVATAAKD